MQKSLRRSLSIISIAVVGTAFSLTASFADVPKPRPWSGDVAPYRGPCDKNTDSLHPFRYRCRRATIGVIQNIAPFTPGLYETMAYGGETTIDAEWAKLKPYWQTGKLMVLMSSACDVDVSDFMARGGAQMQSDIAESKAIDRFNDRLKPRFDRLVFKKVDYEMYCVSDDGKTVVRKAEQGPTVDDNEGEGGENDSAGQTKKSGQSPAYEAPPAKRDDRIVFHLRSLDRNSVQISFYSTGREHEWPGDGQAFDLKDSQFHDFPLSCVPGEKICFGAWRTPSASKYWGVGPNNRYGCQNCCTTCGAADYTQTLEDAGEDTSVTTGLADALQGLATGLSAAAQVHQYNAPTPSTVYVPRPSQPAPTAQGATRNQSTITGGP